MREVKDYRSTYIRKGSERKVISAYKLFGYDVESFQYVESDNEPWERYIYAFNTDEIYDALAGYPAPARKKPYPFPGYVTMVFSLDNENPEYAYYSNVYRLYRRVQFDIFTCSERRKTHRKKMIMPLTFWVVYLLIAIAGAGMIGVTHFYQQNKISSGSTGILFSFNLISSYFESFNDFLSCKAYVIGLVLMAVGVGLIVLHILWDLIYHGLKASANGSSRKKLIKMRNVVLAEVRKKKYPNIDLKELRAIENSHGIYDKTPFTSELRRHEDAVYNTQSRKQKKRVLDEAAKKKEEEAEARKREEQALAKKRKAQAAAQPRRRPVPAKRPQPAPAVQAKPVQATPAPATPAPQAKPAAQPEAKKEN